MAGGFVVGSFTVSLLGFGVPAALPGTAIGVDVAEVAVAGALAAGSATASATEMIGIGLRRSSEAVAVVFTGGAPVVVAEVLASADELGLRLERNWAVPRPSPRSRKRSAPPTTAAAKGLRGGFGIGSLESAALVRDPPSCKLPVWNGPDWEVRDSWRNEELEV